MIAIIDYNTGNLRSLENALRRVGARFCVTADHSVIASATHVVLPGVGEASSAMQKLRDRGLDTLLPTLTSPVLGICIGLQLMCRSSEEGHTPCTGIFNAEVKLLAEAAREGLKVPHVGWDNVEWTSPAHPLLEGIPSGEYFYFVHSYAAGLTAQTLGICRYGAPTSAILAKGNFMGVQFHPEKSGDAGERLLRNFINMKP